jgi:hypothetical protein
MLIVVTKNHIDEEPGESNEKFQLACIIHEGSRVIAEFAASHAPAWSENHSRSYGFRESQAWRREKPQAPG